MNLKSYPALLKFFALLLLLCLGFLFYLVLTNLSPLSAVNKLIKNFQSKGTVYDNTDLYSFSKPLDESEMIEEIISILEDKNESQMLEKSIGINVTDEFLNYANLVSDFSNLTKVITSWDNKLLAFDNSKLFLFQILDNKIYLKFLKVPNIEKISFAYIFKSGSILFCDYQNAYYSQDNLTTFHKSKVLDIDGQPFAANDHGNFFSLIIDNRQIIDGKEIRVWGNYSNYGVWEPGVKRSEQVQVWYTIDEGKTIKAAYKFGYNNPEIRYRHIHAVNMCPWDNSFWVQTGDMSNECHWIQGNYNFENDSWTWDVIASGDQMSNYKSTGFVFRDNYVFWADDSSDPVKHGIWKTKYSNLTSGNINSELFEKVFSTDKEIGMMIGNSEGLMLASQYFKSNDNRYKIFSSFDGGLTWKTINTSLQILNIHPPNAFGKILGNYYINQDTFEAIHFWDGGSSIFINSYLKKNIDNFKN